MKALALIAALLFGVAAHARECIVEYSAQFLGVRYEISPLGEGYPGAHDPDPLIRFDAFDCQTFVETMLARGDLRTLTRIRYDGGRIGFRHRHHFTDMWYLGNRDRLSDITQAMSLMVLGQQASVRESVIDEAAWFRRIHEIEDDRPARYVTTYYIPRAELARQRGRFLAAVVEPMVVLIVIRDFSVIGRLGTDLHVAHMGLLFPSDGGLVFRHASSARGVVLDEDFFQYMARLPQTHVGFQLLSIRN